VSFRFGAFLLVSTFCGSNLFAADEESKNRLRPFFQRFCVDCHGASDDVSGDVNLDAIRSAADLQTDLELLSALADVLHDGEMPPDGEVQPSPAKLQQMKSEIDQLLMAARQRARRIAPVPIRRMNRFQYNNAVIDLFGLKCVVFTLPERMMREHGNYFRPETGRMPDRVTVGSRPLGKSQLIEPRLDGVAAFPQDLRAEHGYDNQADHLSLSPLLMESFLKLGRSIVESPDFTPANVGTWDRFFGEPNGQQDVAWVIRERLKGFLNRAFRRPPDERSLDRYTDFTLRQIDKGATFTAAMKSTASAVIASPRFWYLYESAAGGAAAEPLNDYELASRLSFFLWGSLPDQKLLDLAAAGALADDAVLVRQVDRMLRDPKLKRFCDSFPSQWLQLDRIVSSVPDPQLFPDFYFSKYRDSMHMMLEPLLLFETVLIENRSILQFIDSDFTYRSILLREAYGETVSPEDRKRGRGSSVTKLVFQRLPLTDRRHGGLITTAATMTMTSGAQRTKPITRGAWLASVIFNDPPEPPPADVPPLPESDAKDDLKLTLRERLTAHRERADCRGCHEQIDPLGFALENYNTIGVWRERYPNGRSVDMSGVLFRRHAFDSIEEFKDAILSERDRFAKAFSGHVLAFAVARELEVSDAPAVEAIAGATADDDYRIQTLIKQIVLSEPFQLKQSSPHKTSEDESE